VFVAIEGIEGSGKSTLARGLSEWLRSIGRDVLATREPGGTPLGNAIRQLFLDRKMAIDGVAEAMLVNAARAQHVRDVIRPALLARRVVLCDRFVDSTMAYQGYGRGIDLNLLESLCRAATGGLEPDLTLLIDVPIEVSRARLVEKHSDRLEAEDDAFYERARAGFLKLARTSHRHHVLDGTLTTQELLARAQEVLTQPLRTGPA
jgi:dTMP kinase